jgi:hypothetical protein
MTLEDDDRWGELLEYIEQGTVVPVLGRDLLELESAGPDGNPQTLLLYRIIAEQLARALELSPDAEGLSGPNPLGAVASQFIVQGGSPNLIYRKLPKVLERVVDADPVTGVVKLVHDGAEVRLLALRKLASIVDFRVFVTTTFDPLLANCVAAVRKVAPKVMAYAPGAQEGIQELINFEVGANRDSTLAKLVGLKQPIVVHILGQLANTPKYVVTEEDAFEFVYSLQETRPQGLFDLLSQMRLLIIGCRFPSWLVRFFLRSTRRKRLLQSAVDRTDFIVDYAASEDASLVQFLRNFKTQTEIFANHRPTEFVDELEQRWKARWEKRQFAVGGSITPNAMFVSYASENRSIAERIVNQLNAAGLPVWFDQDSLGSGDEWSRKIRRSIEKAAAVVPIVSHATESSGSREFRREWDYALDFKRGLPPDQQFIFPVVVDDVDRGSEKISEEIRALHWQTLQTPDYALPLKYIDDLKRAYRSSQARSLGT